MKAFQVIENDKYCISEVDIPEISENEVLVKVSYVGICGSDYPRIWGKEARFYPIILGHECSGIVEKTGNNIQEINIGDKIAIAPLVPCMSCNYCQQGLYAQCTKYSFIGSRRNGALAEYVVVPKISIVKIDKRLPIEKAVFLEPLTVGIHGLSLLSDIENIAHKRIGIIGVGSIGILTMQSLIAYGATNVIVLDIDDHKLMNARNNGATSDINLQNVNIETIEKSFDIIIETAGNVHTTKLCLTLADVKGEILYIGTPHANITFEFSEWEQINRKELTIKGSWMNYSSPYPGKEWELAQQWLLEDKINTDVCSITIPLDQLPEKLKKVQNRTLTDKIIVQMNNL